MLPSSRCNDASTLSSIQASPQPPSFLDTYNLSTSSLGCNALCMVISFLVRWSICLRFSQGHFKNGPEYLTRGIARAVTPYIRFILYSFVSSSFLIHLRYSFNIFSLISTCLFDHDNMINNFLRWKRKKKQRHLWLIDVSSFTLHHASRRNGHIFTISFFASF